MTVFLQVCFTIFALPFTKLSLERYLYDLWNPLSVCHTHRQLAGYHPARVGNTENRRFDCLRGYPQNLAAAQSFFNFQAGNQLLRTQQNDQRRRYSAATKRWQKYRSGFRCRHARHF